MRQVGRWLPLVGIAYLTLFGDLTESTALGAFNPQVWWSAWFSILALVALGANITRKRSWATAELSLILVVGVLRSAIYLANGASGPLGVWLVVIGFAIRGWVADRHVPAPSNSTCSRANYCQWAIDPVSGELKNPPKVGEG